MIILTDLALNNEGTILISDYAMAYNLWEQQGLNDMLGLIMNTVGAEVELSSSAKNMVVITAEAGTKYVRW